MFSAGVAVSSPFPVGGELNQKTLNNRAHNQPFDGRRTLCVVVPCHNEAENIPALVSRVQAQADLLENWDVGVATRRGGARGFSVEAV